MPKHESQTVERSTPNAVSGDEEGELMTEPHGGEKEALKSVSIEVDTRRMLQHALVHHRIRPKKHSHPIVTHVASRTETRPKDAVLLQLPSRLAQMIPNCNLKPFRCC